MKIYTLAEVQRIRENRGVEGFLRDQINKGYLLHGSPIDFEYLSSIMASSNVGVNTVGRPFKYSIDGGIYATNCPPLALFYATIGYRGDFCYNIIKNPPLFVADIMVIAARGDGFVYIVPSKTFVRIPGCDGEDYRSAEMRIAPIMKLPVKKDDFVYPIHPLDPWYAGRLRSEINVF